MLLSLTSLGSKFPVQFTRISSFKNKIIRRLLCSNILTFTSRPRSIESGLALVSSRNVSRIVPQSSSLVEIPKDRWGGIDVDSSKHLADVTADTLKAELPIALETWTRNNVNVVTMKIHESHAFLLPVAIASGFTFHHAQPGYAFLKRWMAKAPDTYPPYANHYLGVAGFVLDEEDNLLVIKEMFAARKIWKLPGGSADVGEDLHQVAVREVREETGIECEFKGVVCFRHMHNFRHGCSDFYFVCHLLPISKEIKKCSVEIEECRWMPLTEYMENQAPTAMNKYFVQCFLDYMKQDKFNGVIGKKLVYHHINKVDYNVYSLSGS